MGRQIHVLWAGRHLRRPWEDLCSDYRRRIEHEVAVVDQMVKTRTSGGDPARRKAEGAQLLAALPDPCWSIALDSRGRAMSSQKLSAELHRLLEEWPHPIAFLLGSDLGLDEAARRGCRQCWAFGPMTLGHELARLTLYEQIYRALSMKRGIKYHR